MPCKVICSWTFCELVGGFLDVAIAYLLLCASALAYFVSKFLSLLGLCLPCPCNGLFGNSKNSKCLQGLLLDCPSKKIYRVQLSVKKKFPFDSIWIHDESDCQPDSMSVKRRNLGNNGDTEFEGEASSSSWNEKGSEIGVMNSLGLKEERLGLKRNGVPGQRPRLGLRHRRRKVATRDGKVSTIAPCDSLQWVTAAVSLSTPSVGKTGDHYVEGSMIPVHSKDGSEASKDSGLPEPVSPCLEMDEFVADNKPTEKDSSDVEFKRPLFPDIGNDSNDCNDKNVIRVLEQAVKEEHAARTALYLELEKERSAAATAADEAMSMILRLQNEKAAIEMEARQYQSMIEIKSAYDAEEMNILKKILVNREKEKHFLEKEVEAYRQMAFEKKQLGVDLHDMVDIEEQTASSLLPMPVFQESEETVGKKEKPENLDDLSEVDVQSITSIVLQECTHALEEKIPVPELNEDESSSNLFRGNNEINDKFLETDMPYGDMCLSFQETDSQRPEEPSQSTQSTILQGLGIKEKVIITVVDKEEQSDGTSPCQGLTSKITDAFDETKITFTYNDEDLEKRAEVLERVGFDIAQGVHDVHVVDDGVNKDNEMIGNKSEQLSMSVSLDMLCDDPTMGRLQSELDRKRGSSYRNGGLPPLGSSRGKALLTDLRRYSMSDVDYERLKIENEVGWLRQRLKFVQERREKLNFFGKHMETEKNQLNILRSIDRKIREIQQLMESGNALPLESSPRPSSKVKSKKRRGLSSSLGLQRSI